MRQSQILNIVLIMDVHSFRKVRQLEEKKTRQVLRMLYMVILFGVVVWRPKIVNNLQINRIDIGQTEINLNLNVFTPKIGKI